MASWEVSGTPVFCRAWVNFLHPQVQGFLGQQWMRKKAKSIFLPVYQTSFETWKWWHCHQESFFEMDLPVTSKKFIAAAKRVSFSTLKFLRQRNLKKKFGTLKKRMSRIAWNAFLQSFALNGCLKFVGHGSGPFFEMRFCKVSHWSEPCLRAKWLCEVWRVRLRSVFCSLQNVIFVNPQSDPQTHRPTNPQFWIPDPMTGTRIHLRAATKTYCASFESTDLCANCN